MSVCIIGFGLHEQTWFTEGFHGPFLYFGLFKYGRFSFRTLGFENIRRICWLMLLLLALPHMYYFYRSHYIIYTYSAP